MFAQLIEVMEFFESQFGFSVAVVMSSGASINVIVYVEDGQGETIQVGVASTLIDVTVDSSGYGDQLVALRG